MDGHQCGGEGREERNRSAIVRHALLSMKDGIDPAPSALKIHQGFATFRSQVAELRAEALEKETWADLLLVASRTFPTQ